MAIEYDDSKRFARVSTASCVDTDARAGAAAEESTSVLQA
jgi:hypothetical protein